MAQEVSSTLSPAEKAAIARSIQETLWSKNWKTQELVNRTGISRDTIYDALNSRRPVFTDKTIWKIEQVLEKSFLKPRTEHEHGEHGAAPDDLGAYTFSIAQPYIGEYLCLRPDFKTPRYLYAYLLDISWSDEGRRLVFQEKSRKDEKYTHSGDVYIAQTSPIVNLITIAKGKVRQIMLSCIDEQGMMKGLIQTIHVPFAAASMPVSAPFVMKKTNGQKFILGQIDDRKPDYRSHRQLLEEVTKEAFGKYIGLV